MINVAINGFGRIGRMVFRAGLNDKKINFVGINDLTDTKTLAHLLKYDSTHGTLSENITYTKDSIIVGKKKIKVFAEKDPENLPWKNLKVDVVIESTGFFRTYDTVQKHLKAGAKKVILSAPPKDDKIKMYVMGVNDNKISKTEKIISNASCTTNCLAPLAKVMHENFGIKKGLMTTIHSYTNDQNILDLPHSDLRRARAANLSIIPTTTGAAKAVALVLPEIKGKLDGMAIRVPTPNVSLIDLVVEVEKNTSVEEVNQTLRDASDGPMNKIMRFEEKPLVSIDFNGDSCSSIIDGISTKVIEGNMVKVLSWYDNEWGYSNRVKDLLKFIG